MNKIKVCAFLASPRKNGNTELLLNSAIEGINQALSDQSRPSAISHQPSVNVKVFNLNDLDIMPCQDCGGCNETGKCTYNDDMDQIYEAIRDYDRFILATPVFFAGLSAQAKAMIDRCQTFYCEKYLLKKPLLQKPFTRKGLFIAVGAMTQELEYTCCNNTAKAFFRTISVNEQVDLNFSGIDKKGDIEKHHDALKEVNVAAKNLLI